MTSPVEVLRERGWCKRTLATADGRVCALGAIQHTVSGLRSNLDVVAAAAEVVREQYADRLFGMVDVHTSAVDLVALSWFNDHRDTTQEDVELVLEKAQLVLEERAGR